MPARPLYKYVTSVPLNPIWDGLEPVLSLPSVLPCENPLFGMQRKQQPMNAIQIAEFFLSRRGRCFEGWSTDKVFYYILVNHLHDNIFVARDRFGLIALAAIAWLDDEEQIVNRDIAGLPQFDWEHPKGWTPNGDSILIADVAGDRSLMPEILKQAMVRWGAHASRVLFRASSRETDAVARPDARETRALPIQKRLFTYRRGKLAELSWTTVYRFSNQT